MSELSQKKIRILGSPIISVVFFVVIVLLSKDFLRPVEAQKKVPGEAVEVVSAKKVERGEKHDAYPTSPPTSGWYVDSSQRDGVFTSPILDEEIVAALLRGSVVIAYNCAYKSEKIDPSNATPVPSGVIDDSSAQSLSDPKAGGTTVGKNGKISPKDQAPQQTKEDMMQVYSQIKRQNVQCGNVVVPLRKIVEESGSDKLMLVPYAKMDARIVLLSWGRMDKLLWFDEKRIKDFMEAFRGKIPASS